MKDEIIICDCSSAEHQMVLRFDEEDKMVYVEIHLVNKRWYERLWMGIKYILGYKCCYGNFEEMVLTQKHARQVYNLYRFLRPKLTKEELAKLANSDGQAVEIGLKKGDNDGSKD
jgi:hypothetical protein